jgi:hypothetical protein
MPNNLELGVQRAMVASLIASGVKQQQAQTRVTPAKIALGVKYLKTAFTTASRAGEGDDESCWDAAFQSLKAWTPANT